MPTNVLLNKGIDRRAGLANADFVREYLQPRKPVVITDALAHLPALGRWTPRFFQEKFPDRSVPIDGAPRPLGPFIDEVLRSTPEQPAPYLRNEVLAGLFPELAAEIEPLPPYLRPNWLDLPYRREDAKILNRCGATEIYIGGAGRSFPVVHFDWIHTHAFLMQFHGRKQYCAYAPDQTPYMYPVADDPNRSQVGDVEHPDLEKFPLFAQARGIFLTLDPGEMLFMPAGWWHTARMITASITVSVNIANASNWRDLRADFCASTRRQTGSRKKARQMDAYLRLIGLGRSLREIFP